MSEVTLEDLASLTVGYAFKSGEFVEPGEGIRLVRCDNIGHGSLRWHGAKAWSPTDADIAETYSLEVGDVVVAMDRPWIASGLKRAVIRNSDLPCLLVQRVARLRAKPGTDQGFIYALVESQGFTEHVLSVQTGTTVPHISGRQILSFPVRRLPSLEEQRAIAGLLGALDDKIESNRRIAAMAQDLADAMFASATGTSRTLGDVADVVMGSSPPGSTYNEVGRGMPFYQGVADFDFRFPRLRVYCDEPVRTAEAGDALVSVRAPVGRLNRAQEKCCIGRGLAALRSRTPRTLYYALRAAGDVWAPYNAEGTVFGAIKAADMQSVRIPWPDDGRLTECEQDLVAVDDRLSVALLESVSLASLRDSLLPELLSGRLRVRDAEEMVESG